MKKYLCVSFLTVLMSVAGFSQHRNNRRVQVLSLKTDTLRIDTLSIIPNSFSLTDTLGNAIDTSQYKIDYPKSLLITSNAFRLEHPLIIAEYRIFPYDFSKVFYHKKPRFEPDESGMVNPFIITYQPSQDFFSGEKLSKSGSISRGISFGNNQDVVVNSSLNLQLSGRLSDDVEILAAVTDNNIPIQPEGNTQQIQEFDKVFVQLSNKQHKLIAGDFELTRPESHFMNFFKKAQGGSYIGNFTTGKDETKAGTVNLRAAAAVSKGKYGRNLLQGAEGNQGPYKLRGSNNESFIIVLAGSEKVFIDGRLLTRGQENDYVINYNTAEISFTPKNLITKDKRIVVEFEYVDKNYARSMLYTGADLNLKKVGFRVNYFSEQDLKNQPLNQDLTQEQKILLSSVGDSIQKAIVPNIDSIAFTADQVLYKMVDTLVNSIFYDSVFVYSTNPDSAHYQLGFSLVGQGNGNYRQIKSSANGRVFEWVAPVSGIPQGVYEPIILLITPKKIQMLTLGSDFLLRETTKASVELAVSNNDINTFSNINNEDNTGLAFRINLENSAKPKEERKWLATQAGYFEWIDKKFNPVERYRNVEFERDWNVTAPVLGSEYLAGLTLGLKNKKAGDLQYQLNSYNRGNVYRGMQNNLIANVRVEKFHVNAKGSLLQSHDQGYNTKFIRSNATLARKMKPLTIGIREEQEHNTFKKSESDSLMGNSFAFFEWEAFLQNNDTATNTFLFSYRNRKDMYPKDNAFKQLSEGQTLSGSLGITKNPNHTLALSSSYRILTYKDSVPAGQKPDKSVTGRIEHSLRLFKGAVSTSTFYEAGSGQETKREFSYLEVPAGQGVYTWTDFNQNGVKELNEFDVAAFSDQARYIRVFMPTNEFIKVYMASLSEILNLNPAAVWNNKKGWRGMLAKFSNQSAYSIERKIQGSLTWSSFNPLENVLNDTALISLSSSLRNTFYFNRSHPKFGAELSYSSSQSKTLLINGYESRAFWKASPKIRYNLNKWITLTLTAEKEEKENNSEYFTSRNFLIVRYSGSPELSWQPSRSFRLNINFEYSSKENTLGNPREKATGKKAGIELTHSVAGKGSLIFRITYIDFDFNAPEDNPLAFEMLESLKTGKNATWNLSYQRNLSNNLQINLMYDGRKSPEAKAIHVGNVQLRAYF